MPKNTGGKGHKRSKNHANPTKRILREKLEGEEYGQITRMLGNLRAEVTCFGADGPYKLLCHVCGKMRKRVWVNQHDIVLVGLRDQRTKGDIIHKYNGDESRTLKKDGLLPNSTTIDDKLDDNDVPFEFTMEGSDSDSEEALLDQPTNRGMLPPSDSESEGDLDDL